MQQQTQDVTLLQEVYHNASMGERGSKLMLDKSKDAGLSAKLSEFSDAYSNIKREAADRISTYGQAPKQSSALEDAAQWMGVQLGTLIDQSPSRMAEMLIQGSAKSMIKSIEDIKRNHDTEKRTRELAGRLVSLENDSLAAMKTYLS